MVSLLAVSACGSSDDDGSTADDADSGSEADSSGSDDAGSSSDDGSTDDSSGGNGTGTLTIADGTVYEFEMNSCDTSDTDPEGFPLDLGYDLTGSTADGEFRIFLGRAGFDDESAVASGSLEGGFDENGQNASILYRVSRESLDQLSVDGGTVTGDLALSEVIPGGPHGDEISATVQVSC